MRRLFTTYCLGCRSVWAFSHNGLLTSSLWYNVNAYPASALCHQETSCLSTTAPVCVAPGLGYVCIGQSL